MPSRTLLIWNPGSGRVRRSPRALDGLRSAVGEACGRAARDAAEVCSAVRELAPGPDDLLCVAGGDGTLQAILTALDEIGGEWPRFVMLQAGSTNMTAVDHQGRRRLDSASEAVRAWIAAGHPGGRRIRRRVLRIESGARAPLLGFFFGIGAITEGVRIFEERLRGVGRPGEWAGGLAAARVALSAVLGRTAVPGELEVRTDWSGEGVAWDSVRVLAQIASTLDRLILGARPFWGTEAGALDVTRVEADARHLGRRLWRVALGRPGRHLRSAEGYASHATDRLVLDFEGPFILDGERFELAAGDGPLVLTAPREIEWVVPW
ncbi:MAG: diacylglycerol kinase family protein [Longimicrobiales bacterium]|nr:diacylglycerol kinase family protein [Longimicrobiales bacterium]